MSEYGRDIGNARFSLFRDATLDELPCALAGICPDTKICPAALMA